MTPLERFRAGIWRAQEAAAKDASSVGPGGMRRASDAPFIVRAGYAGALPGYPISDHFRELETCVEWVWVATSNKAKQYAQATCSLKKPTGGVQKAYQGAPDSGDDGLTAVGDHPFKRLLKRPNPLTSGSIFLYQLGHSIELTGGAVVWVRKNQLGQPAEMWVLPRGWLFYQRPTAEYPYGWWRVTPYQSRWSGWFGTASAWPTTWALDVRETVQIGWPSPLYPGEFQSSLAACSRLIDVATQTETAVSAKMKNAIFPAVLLSVVSQNGTVADPLIDEQIEKLKAQIKEAYAGASNAGTTLIGNNLMLQEYGQTMEAMQGTEARKQAREFVLNVFGVPPAATGATEETSYAAFSAAMKAYISLSIDPVLMLISEGLTDLAQQSWPGLEVHYDARVYDDPQLALSQATEIKDAVKSGGATWNEWRKKMGLPARPDCDELVQQPDPNAAAMADQPGGDPTGMNGSADSDPFDLDLSVDDLGDDTTTGQRRPELSAASGNRMPSHLLNGNGKGH